MVVGAGQRAVLFSWAGGMLARQLNEGTHFIVPFVQRPIFYDVRTQTYTMSEVSWEGEMKWTKRWNRVDDQEVTEVECTPDLNSHIPSTQSDFQAR